MKNKTIAIGRNSQVSIWCNNIREYNNGTITFDVINGAWSGTLKDGLIYIKGEKIAEGEVLWKGICPHDDYNEAIPWIQEQVDDRSRT